MEDPVEKYRDLLSPEEFRLLLEAIQRPLPPAIRLNTLKISPEQALKDWPERYGWQIRQVPFCPAGWQILSPETRPSQTPEFKMGFYFIQDAASMLPVELFDFAGLDQPLILDMAASPGGKSTHLASRSQDRGLLVANDNSYSRLPALQTALLDWGAVNAVVTHFPGERFGSWFPEVFDRVLLDAPCSMDNLRPESSRSTSGRSTSGRPRREISDRERQGLANRQLNLLGSAFRALKVGGELVYATCTLAPEEDEAVVDGLLRAFPGMVKVVAAGARLGGPPGIEAPALVEAGGARAGGGRFDPQVRLALRLWPHRYGTAGFFAALLTKTGSVSRADHSRHGDPPYRPFEKLGLARVNRGGRAALFARFEEAYGFNLEPVFEQQGLSLWKREGAYLALPEVFLNRFSDFPCHWVGFAIGEDTRDGFIPSHELVARFGSRFGRGKTIIPLIQAGTWLRGSDVEFEAVKDGPVLAQSTSGPGPLVRVVEDDAGRLLGRGKILSDRTGGGYRIKNLLPRRLAVGM